MENPYEYAESPPKAEPARLPLPETFLFEEKEPEYFNLKYILLRSAVAVAEPIFIGLVFYISCIPFLVVSILLKGGHVPDEMASIIWVIIIALPLIVFGIDIYLIVFCLSVPSVLYRICDRILSISHEMPFEGMRCQITTFPRRNKGICRRLLDNADDLGWIRIEENGIRFQGDQIHLFIPGEIIEEFEYTNKAKIRHFMGTQGTQITLKRCEGIPFKAIGLHELESRKSTEMRKMRKKLHESVESLCDRF